MGVEEAELMWEGEGEGSGEGRGDDDDEEEDGGNPTPVRRLPVVRDGVDGVTGGGRLDPQKPDAVDPMAGCCGEEAEPPIRSEEDPLRLEGKLRAVMA